MINFNDYLEKDITVHTEGHKYRGVLEEVQGVRGRGVLVFKQGVDRFVIMTEKVVAVTLHGREFGTEE